MTVRNVEEVARLEAELYPYFRDLAELQRTIREKLSNHSDNKTLKGDELVGWLGEIYGKLLFGGTLVDDSAEHDFVAPDGSRVSVKTRRGTNAGWRRSSIVPRIEGEDCPTHMLFVHLNDDYSVDCMWMFRWADLVVANRFVKHKVRGSERGFFFTIDPAVDEPAAIYRGSKQHG